MRLRNVYRILAAAACAGAATYLTVSFYASRTPPPRPLVAVPKSPPARNFETKTVIVAAKPLQFGAVLTVDALAEVQWPAASVPPGAFHNREALLGASGQRRLLTAVGKNEPILASKVTGPGQRGSLSAVIGDGMMAVTIRVDDVLGVAGFVQPGDRVNVFLIRNERAAAAGGKAKIEASSEVLLQNVLVLAVDQDSERAGKVRPAKAVTVEVDGEGAAKVSLGQEIGRLFLALRPVGADSDADYHRIDVKDLSKQRKPGVRTVPENPEKQPATDATVVTVTRGTDRTMYEITKNGRQEIKVSSKAAPEPPAPPPPAE
jgi:pilus assembly protein CpaB